MVWAGMTIDWVMCKSAATICARRDGPLGSGKIAQISRRRGSATALQASEVVVALAMTKHYMPI